MQQYNTEEGIDFYSELSKSLNNPIGKIDEINEIEENENNKCLISNTILTENSITLECNHKFNYIPLVNDLTNHKLKFNYNESRILKLNEIRCPYCRNVQKNLLPYYDIHNVKKIHGVNFIDETKTKINKISGEGEYLPGKCNFETTDSSGNICKCSKLFVTNVSVLGKTFCYQHKFTSLSIYLTAKKNKDVMEKKMLAAKIKEEKKLLAIKTKFDAKEAKKLLDIKTKEEKKILTDKAKEDKKLLDIKAKEEKKLLDTKAKEEKKLLDIKAKEDKKNTTKNVKNVIINQNIIIPLKS